MTNTTTRTPIAGFVLLGLGFAAMAAALVYGFARGGGWAEVAELTGYPWFNVSLVDVYVGFALFGAWIVRREPSPLVATVWIVLILALGNLIACGYALLALARSRGDARLFWMGPTASSR